MMRGQGRGGRESDKIKVLLHTCYGRRHREGRSFWVLLPCRRRLHMSTGVLSYVGRRVSKGFNSETIHKLIDSWFYMCRKYEYQYCLPTHRGIWITTVSNGENKSSPPTQKKKKQQQQKQHAHAPIKHAHAPIKGRKQDSNKENKTKHERTNTNARTVLSRGTDCHAHAREQANKRHKSKVTQC